MTDEMPDVMEIKRHCGKSPRVCMFKDGKIFIQCDECGMAVCAPTIEAIQIWNEAEPATWTRSK